MQSAEFWLKKIFEILNGTGGDSGSSGLETSPPASTTANAPTIKSAASALVANSNRKGWSIQNLGTNALYVRFGANASTTVFHVALKAGAVNDDGNGGYYSDEMWKGEVTIAGTSPRYTVAELT